MLENRPDLSREKLERTRHLMNLHAEGSLVTDYEPLIAELTLPDANDRHVLAAAIVSEADVIVTFNLSDFPTPALAAYGIVALHPDGFLGSLFDQEPETFIGAVQEIVSALKHPPRTLEQHLDILRAQGLGETVKRLTAHLPESENK